MSPDCLSTPPCIQPASEESTAAFLSSLSFLLARPHQSSSSLLLGKPCLLRLPPLDTHTYPAICPKGQISPLYDCVFTENTALPQNLCSLRTMALSCLLPSDRESLRVRKKPLTQVTQRFTREKTLSSHQCRSKGLSCLYLQPMGSIEERLHSPVKAGALQRQSAPPPSDPSYISHKA